MDIIKLLTDYHIPYSTEHKNVRSGWVGIEDCPFCRSQGKFHLGYNTYEDYFSCWSCGGHSHEYVIAKLLGVSYGRAEKILSQYGGKVKSLVEPRIRMGNRQFKLPSNTHEELNNYHKTYLIRRGFDPIYLQAVWGIMGTGMVSKLDGISYARRILAPVYWDGKLVTFQARDITNRHKAKYMACPPERERMHHKHILYGIQERWGKIGICVEGIFDAWRIGTDSFATFGIKYTWDQVRAMVHHFKAVAVMFDPDPQAQAQAKKLVKDLELWGIPAWNVNIPSDPGSLRQDFADDLVESILNTKWT